MRRLRAAAPVEEEAPESLLLKFQFVKKPQPVPPPLRREESGIKDAIMRWLNEQL